MMVEGRIDVGRTAKRLVERIGKNKYMIAAIAAGLFMLLIPSWKGSEKVPAQTVEDASGGFDLATQEKRLAETLSGVDGAGKVTVMLTVKSGSERVVASDGEMKTSAERTENATRTVIVNNNGESAVTLKYLYPEYRGAVIIAEGAGSPTVRLALTQAVSAVTGLSADRITVLKMKG